MTHTSGLKVVDELDKQFGNARTQGGVRYLRVLIKGESIVPEGTYPLSASLENDWKSMNNLLEPKKPCYILFRLDTTNATGYDWILISYIPEGSPVYDRMMYASSRDPLKKQLGLTYFSDVLHGSDKEDLTWEAYQIHREKLSAPSPYTAAEVQYKNETTAEVDHGTSREYVHSVKFPLSDAAKRALKDFSSSKNLVQLSVDTNRETIELVKQKSCGVEDLVNELDKNEPRFTFFKYEHDHEGESFESNLFIYSCPPNSPVKLKMLYSTVKSVAAGAAEEAGITIERSGKIEVTDAEEDLTLENITSQLHPVPEKIEKFQRPMRPGRGKPRLTRTGGRGQK